jgi:methyl-accepting chemotaxis protein
MPSGRPQNYTTLTDVTQTGVLAFQMPIDRLNAVMLDPTGLGETGDTVIVGTDGLRRSGSRFSEEAALLQETISWPGTDSALRAEVGTVAGEIDGVPVLTSYAPVRFHGTTWGVIASITEGEAFAASEELVFYELIIGGFVVVFALAIGVGFSRTITTPLSRIVSVMSKVSQGDYDVTVPGKDRSDEVGEIAQALDVFRQNGAEAQTLRSEQERMREMSEEQRIDALRNMARTVETEAGRAVEQVSVETSRMAEQAEGMANSSQRVEQNSQTVAAAAQEALANVESVSAATEELSASIEEISSRVADGATTARVAMEVGEESQVTIQSLADAANKIGTVAVLIDDIAKQTGLLALNATIEAARAGDAGKGFAVVASEVKNLAAQTTKATGEISSQIQEIQSVTQRSVDAVGSMVERIRAVDEVSASVATAVEEQQAATREIARNVSETAGAARDVAENIELVSAEARANLDTAAAVQEASELVTKSMEDLKQVVVRVVRTSAPEVDRRSSERRATSDSARLSLDGQDYAVTLTNISEGGVGVEAAAGVTFQAGQRGDITSPQIGRRPVKVAGQSGQQIGLEYAD